MSLNMEIQTVHQVDAFDLDEFINEVFRFTPGTFNFVAAEESSNDVSHQFTVSPVDNGEELAKWMDSNGTAFVYTGDILDHLCWKGLIPAGNYIVNVCW